MCVNRINAKLLFTEIAHSAYNYRMNDKSANKLSNISEILVGYPFRGVLKEVPKTNIYVVQLKDSSKEDGINWSTCLETELTGKRKPDWLKTNDILFSTRGRNNHAVLVGEIPEGIKVVASPHFFIIKCNNKKLLPEYLTWLLNQPPCQRHFKREAEGSSTKIIKRTVLENTPITIPSPTKQKSIVNLVNTLKKEQQILKQLIDNGETMMNAIASDLFASNSISETY